MRKVLVPKPVSEAIGALSLGRAVLVQLLTRVHLDISRTYDDRKMFRAKGAEDTHYRHSLVVKEAGVRHLFVLTIDDTTSQDNLIIDDIRHVAR